MNMTRLPEHSLDLFREKIAGFPVGNHNLDRVYKWWIQSEDKLNWVARFRRAVEALPKGSPEKADAKAAFAGCEDLVEEINSSLLKLLERKTGSGFFETFVEPYLSLLRIRPEVRLMDHIIGLIKRFEEEYWTTDNDQIIAVGEAYVNGGEALELVRLEFAQWAFEEISKIFPWQQMAHLFDGIDEQTTQDELEIELMELSDAIEGDPWISGKRERYRRIFKRIRHVMDVFEFDTEVKRSYTKAFAYATGHIGKTVSAIDILQNAEFAWQGIKSDPTLQEFWVDEQDRLENPEDEEEE